MLTIICGENSSSSRNYFISLKDKYKKDDIEVMNLVVNDIAEIPRWLDDSPSLFNDNKVYFIENLNKKINRKSNKDKFDIVEDLINDKSVAIFDWENEIPARQLKVSKGVTVKEFKLPAGIFQLLDSCYPTNLKTFLIKLDDLVNNYDEIFIYTMLSRHIRTMLLVKNQVVPEKLMSWQISKLKKQAMFWSTNKLISFYDGLHRIDVSVKTSKNPYSIKKSLDLLACLIL